MYYSSSTAVVVFYVQYWYVLPVSVRSVCAVLPFSESELRGYAMENLICVLFGLLPGLNVAKILSSSQPRLVVWVMYIYIWKDGGQVGCKKYEINNML